MVQKIVLTGAKGVGKTGVLEKFREVGYFTMSEVAPFVLNGQANGKKPRLPENDQYGFQRLVAQTQLDWEKHIPSSLDFSFQVGGLPDGLAYLARSGEQIIPELQENPLSGRYHRVFLFEPPVGFTEDTGGLHDAIRDAYQSCGYKPISVPRLAPKDRADFILERV
ncbi:MAG: AAA family ATPase [Candidatus Woesearchaeota archaeon]